MDLTDLRQAAIELLGERCDTVETLHEQSPHELIHELRVHQAELEMQNEELRRAQLELEEQRDKFAVLFDFAPMGYVTLNDVNRIVEANLTIARLLGVPRGTLVGQVLSQYVIPADATQLSRHLHAINQTENKVNCELTLRKANGEDVRVRLDSVSIIDDRRCVAITDLSENTKLLRAKRESDERLRIICETLPIPIAFIDRAEIYQFNNAAHERWFRVPRELIAGRSVRDFLGEGLYAQAKPCIQRTLIGQTSSCSLEVPQTESGPRACEVYYAPCRDARGDVVGCYELMLDVSDSRHVEEEEARRAELQEKLCSLSTRQRAVFDLLMAGFSNKVITSRLNVSMRTVERERHEILERLGVDSSNELLVSFAGLADADGNHRGS